MDERKFYAHAHAYKPEYCESINNILNRKSKKQFKFLNSYDK